MGWSLKLINDMGLEVASEFSEKETITTKDIGELDWELSDGDQLVLEEI